MDISTFNTIISATATLVGIAFSVVLGAILTYVRATNKDMKEIKEMTIKHDVEIHQLKAQTNDLYDKVYKLNKAA